MIIIDSRMRKEEKEYLMQYGNLLEIKPQNTVYEEISAHPDIFFCKIDDKIFRATNIDINVGKLGESKVSSKYPNDIRYNVCQIGEYVIHNFKYTDPKVLEYINSKNLIKVQVNQGYSKCSICPTSEKSCITSDIGIYNILKDKGIDVLYLQEKIKLLNKKGQKTKMNGFIGGGTAVIGNTFILFGDIEKITQKERLIEHLKKYNLELKYFPKQEIIDYGGIIEVL